MFTECQTLYTVGVQGFYNEVCGFVIKELAVVRVVSDHLVRLLVIKLPSSFLAPLLEKFKRSNRWLTDFFSMVYRGVLALQSSTIYIFQMEYYM
jgi:hypothetical protein